MYFEKIRFSIIRRNILKDDINSDSNAILKIDNENENSFFNVFFLFEFRFKTKSKIYNRYEHNKQRKFNRILKY